VRVRNLVGTICIRTDACRCSIVAKHALPLTTATSNGDLRATLAMAICAVACARDQADDATPATYFPPPHCNATSVPTTLHSGGITGAAIVDDHVVLAADCTK
jgi:hypothetical protein